MPGPKYEIERFERMGFFGKRYYFRCRRIGNGEIVFPSQPYKSKVQRNATSAELAAALKAPITAVAK